MAVEEADARGLIALEQVDGRVQVRVSHPLYAEVRRRRAPSTRLRRLRGVVVAELDTSTGRDETQTVVRRAALTLDSDLNPDRDLLVRGAQGAMRVGDLTLADRLADAGICVGGGVEARLVRAQALWWLGREREAEAVLADLSADTEVGDDRMTLLRACIRLWSLGDPDGAKAIIDAPVAKPAGLAALLVGKPDRPSWQRCQGLALIGARRGMGHRGGCY